MTYPGLLLKRTKTSDLTEMICDSGADTLQPLIENVKAVLIETLKLGPQAARWKSDTPLLGAVAELDSLAVINVITALEDRFGIHIEDDEVSGDIFATLGTLTDFIEEKMND